MAGTDLVVNVGSNGMDRLHRRMAASLFNSYMPQLRKRGLLVATTCLIHLVPLRIDLHPEMNEAFVVGLRRTRDLR